MDTPAGRRLFRIVDAMEGQEGAGFRVQRAFPTPQFPGLDPFLLLDEMGPSDHRPGEAKGAPDHPHRGFETVTYMLAGEFEHHDSHGNAGKLRPGDVQWMTAGGGVVHSEMPSARLMKEGGRLHGFQLWVNLPKKDKMVRPRYQDTASDKIPVAETDDGKVWVKVIAGAALGKEAVIDTRTPIFYYHVKIQPGGNVTLPTPRDHNAFLYAIDGWAEVGPDDKVLKDAQAGLLTEDADEVLIKVPEDAEEAFNGLLIGGIPLKEPVARWGPFVMNDFDEIRQAVADFQAGRFGEIPARTA